MFCWDCWEVYALEALAETAGCDRDSGTGCRVGIHTNRAAAPQTVGLRPWYFATGQQHPSSRYDLQQPAADACLTADHADVAIYRVMLWRVCVLLPRPVALGATALTVPCWLASTDRFAFTVALPPHRMHYYQ